MNTASTHGSQESLVRWLTWLYGDPNRCKCDHRYVSAGRLHGIDMGRQWARTTTHPDCPEHGTAAAKARDARLRGNRVRLRAAGTGERDETP